MKLNDWVIYFLDKENNASIEKFNGVTEKTSPSDVQAMRDDMELIFPRAIRKAYLTYFRGLFLVNGKPNTTIPNILDFAKYDSEKTAWSVDAEKLQAQCGGSCAGYWHTNVPPPMLIPSGITVIGYRLRNYHSVASMNQTQTETIRDYIRFHTPETDLRIPDRNYEKHILYKKYLESTYWTSYNPELKPVLWRFWKNMFTLAFDMIQDYFNIGCIDTYVSTFFDDLSLVDAKTDMFAYDMRNAGYDVQETPVYSRSQMYIARKADPTNEGESTHLDFYDKCYNEIYELTSNFNNKIQTLLNNKVKTERSEMEKDCLDLRKEMWKIFASYIEKWLSEADFVIGPYGNQVPTQVGVDFNPMVSSVVAAHPLVTGSPDIINTPLSFNLKPFPIIDVPEEYEFKE